jgi:hypothetical protein
MLSFLRADKIVIDYGGKNGVFGQDLVVWGQKWYCIRPRNSGMIA